MLSNFIISDRDGWQHNDIRLLNPNRNLGMKNRIVSETILASC